jgi:hypothetical protein
MADNITDTYNFTITVNTHGNLQISNVVAPAQVWENTPFDITYDATNNGGQDACYGVITDGTNPLPGSRWDETIESGATKNCTYTCSGLTSDLNGTIEVGYVD